MVFVPSILLASGGAAVACEPNGGGSVDEDQIQTKISNMTLEEKVGQMFTLQVFGQSTNDKDPAAIEGNQNLYGVDTIEGAINKYKPGGIAYFGGPDSQGIPDNVDNPHQIARLSNDIQKAATGQQAGIPMLISTDQEQGLVLRVGELERQCPGSMALAAPRSPDYALQAA